MVFALPALTLLPSASSPARGRFGEASPHYAEVAPASAVSSVAGLLQTQLDSLFLECCCEGWDGYGAQPVSVEAYSAAHRFICSLPAGFPMPELAADPDGCVNFDWHVSLSRTLVVSVHPDFRVDFAALIGAAKIYGSEPFFSCELPASVRDLVRRVCAA